MDKDLLNQYKYMDTPAVTNPNSTREQQDIQKKQANFLFNILSD